MITRITRTNLIAIPQIEMGLKSTIVAIFGCFATYLLILVWLLNSLSIDNYLVEKGAGSGPTCVGGNCKGLPTLSMVIETGTLPDDLSRSVYGQAESQGADSVWLDWENDGLADAYLPTVASEQFRDFDDDGTSDELRIDLNSDGQPDITATRYDRRLINGSVDSYNYGSVTQLDIDRDGDIDLTLDDSDGDGIPIIVQAGGLENLLSKGAVEIGFSDLSIVDGNRDQVADTVLIDSNGDGVPEFSEPPQHFALEDFDNDGTFDLITYRGDEGDVRWQSYANLESYFKSESEPGHLLFESFVAVDDDDDQQVDRFGVDMNGDGMIDLIEPNDGSYIAGLNLDNDPTQFEAIEIRGVDHQLSSLTFFDSIVDLVTVQDGEISADAFTSLDLNADGIPDIVTVDVNGDGLPDIVDTPDNRFSFVHMDNSDLPAQLLIDADGDGNNDIVLQSAQRNDGRPSAVEEAFTSNLLQKLQIGPMANDGLALPLPPGFCKQFSAEVPPIGKLNTVTTC